MSLNPFLEKPKKIESTIMSMKMLSPKPYDKNEVDPYTRVRCILMNGTEYEAVWSKHHVHRHCPNNDIRRAIGLVRKLEQQQQKLISALKPADENILQTTIGYEQLAVDLTAILAQRQTDKNVKNALDFALLEDFDHLYRYANLLETDMGEHAERYVGSYTEIMPGRPTVAHHRHPYDEVKYPINNKNASPITKCDVAIITAAEQQTMNYYMNIAQFYSNQRGRELYAEIGMVEEEHVTHYGSLIDTKATLFESLLMHEYTECYIYYSLLNDESDNKIKKIWEILLEQEIAHLHLAKELLQKYEGKEYHQVIPDSNFPMLLKLQENKDYVRDVLKNTVTLTAEREGYADVCDLKDNSTYFIYQNAVNTKPECERGHTIIKEHIKQFNQDYRYQESEHPIECLQDRTKDNYTLGVKKCEKC